MVLVDFDRGGGGEVELGAAGNGRDLKGKNGSEASPRVMICFSDARSEPSGGVAP